MEVVFTPNDIGKKVYHAVYGEGIIKYCSDSCAPPERFTLTCGFHAIGSNVTINGYGQTGITTRQAVFKGPVRLRVEEEYDDWKTPPLDLKVDDPVIIKDVYCNWVNRHFSRWAKVDGQWLMYVFNDGLTSHSVETFNGFTEGCVLDWKLPKKDVDN